VGDARGRAHLCIWHAEQVSDVYKLLFPVKLGHFRSMCWGTSIVTVSGLVLDYLRSNQHSDGPLTQAGSLTKALCVRKHVHVCEDIGGLLFRTSPDDFRQFVDGGIFVARLVTGGARQSVISHFPL
jgi:hypothetical protein